MKEVMVRGQKNIYLDHSNQSTIIRMSELFDFLPHMKEDERTLLLQMTVLQQMICTFFIVASLILGSVMKAIVYCHIST